MQRRCLVQPNVVLTCGPQPDVLDLNFRLPLWEDRRYLTFADDTIWAPTWLEELLCRRHRSSCTHSSHSVNAPYLQKEQSSSVVSNGKDDDEDQQLQPLKTIVILVHQQQSSSIKSCIGDTHSGVSTCSSREQDCQLCPWQETAYWFKASWPSHATQVADFTDSVKRNLGSAGKRSYHCMFRKPCSWMAVKVPSPVHRPDEQSGEAGLSRTSNQCSLLHCDKCSLNCKSPKHPKLQFLLRNQLEVAIILGETDRSPYCRTKGRLVSTDPKFNCGPSFWTSPGQILQSTQLWQDKCGKTRYSGLPTTVLQVTNNCSEGASPGQV